MGVYQGNDFKKISGGLKGKSRDKRKFEMGSPPTNTTLSTEDVKIKERTFGGNLKYKLRYAVTANVYDPTTKQAKKSKILAVLETPSNPELARRGIITKGTRIRTELGEAIVTSRPGQDGIINAILIK
ncbi:MAG: 30S ribosomal protein S8e [Sulfolobaceae archaeon]|nr:30S ribosomal protein S8e [Sulfolobaceae archaeon]